MKDNFPDLAQPERVEKFKPAKINRGRPLAVKKGLKNASA